MWISTCLKFSPLFARKRHNARNTTSRSISSSKISVHVWPTRQTSVTSYLNYVTYLRRLRHERRRHCRAFCWFRHSDISFTFRIVCPVFSMVALHFISVKADLRKQEKASPYRWNFPNVWKLGRRQGMSTCGWYGTGRYQQQTRSVIRVPSGNVCQWHPGDWPQLFCFSVVLLRRLVHRQFMYYSFWCVHRKPIWETLDLLSSEYPKWRS